MKVFLNVPTKSLGEILEVIFLILLIAFRAKNRLVDQDNDCRSISLEISAVGITIGRFGISLKRSVVGSTIVPLDIPAKETSIALNTKDLKINVDWAPTFFFGIVRDHLGLPKSN